MPADDPRPQQGALRMVVRNYFAQLRTDARVSVPALLLPGIGNILVFYLPPLVVAKILSAFQEDVRPAPGRLAWYVAAMAGVWFGGEMLWRLGIHALNRTDMRGMRRLYADALDRLLERDAAFFNDNFAGSLTKRALGYARQYEDFVDIIAFQVIGETLPVLFAGAVLWQYSPWLIVALFGIIGLTTLIVRPMIIRRQKLVDDAEAASNRLAGHLSDAITNMEAVRAYAREDHEARVHRENIERYAEKTLRSWDHHNLRIDLVTSPLFVIANTLGLSIALVVGGTGPLGVEAVFVTFSYFVHATRVMWEFNQIYRRLERAITDAGQFTQLLLDEPTVVDVAEPVPFRPADASIELQDVVFGHRDREDRLFDGFSLRIEDGERVGLVGRSGGGKTTLTRLLLRFMDVNGGRVLIGGQDIARVPQRELRAFIGTVPQDPMMFHRSLADNIRFGRLDATDEEVRRAAELAHAAEFIESLPDGYATLVGERGVKLSGGQRQRIAIARAIVKDAPVLVLDEATSSLDSESEGLIQDALWRLMQDRTAIVIAHRLSTVRRMDRLVVLDGGRIVEEGTHDSLLAAGGVYAMLWAHQSGGFLVDDGADEGAAEGAAEPIRTV